MIGDGKKTSNGYDNYTPNSKCVITFDIVSVKFKIAHL